MIIVFGANGMLGSTLVQYFKSQKVPYCAYTRSDLDASETGTLLEKLEQLKARDNWGANAFIINAVGMIPQKNPDVRSYIRVNSIFPHFLQTFCEQHDAKLIHVTTDCVFTGETDIGYAENAKHDEASTYGASKSCGEPENAMIIRTSIIGEELSGKKSLLEWVLSQEGQEVNGFTNHHWNGLTCLQLAKVIRQIIDSHYTWTGVRHIVSRPITKYGLVHIINSVYRLNCTVKPHSTSKRVNRVMLPSEDPVIRNIQIPELDEQIREMYSFHRDLELSKL